MMELVKDAEAFAAEIGTELTTLWTEFKSFVRNKPVEEAVPNDPAPITSSTPSEPVPENTSAPVAEAVTEPVAAPAIDVVS